MKRLLSGLLLLSVLPAWGQEGVDLSIVPHGIAVRGRPIDFSVMAGPGVKRLSSLAFNLGVDANLGYGFELENQLYPITSPVGVSFARLGDGLKGTRATIAAPGLTKPVLILFDPPFSGPGEIARFSSLIPIDAETNRAISAPAPSASLLNVLANDVEGNTLALNVMSSDVSVEIRRFGDVNGDGHLTQADAILILRSLVGLRPLTEVESFYADIQPTSTTGKPIASGRYLGDGKVTVSDARRVLEVITGLWKYWWPDPR